MRNGLWLVGVVAILGASSGAAGQGNDSSYRRAQEMVANGDAKAGRALLDSLMHATSPDSVSYANALYWHAVLATSAADAELDYRRIIVDYPTSPRVQDALLRIGQLEITRGEYDEALQHLRRIPAEYPSSPERAKASYWIARTLFEKGDASNACAANADAEAHTTPSDVELKNQIDYQQQRCRGVAVAPPSAAQDNGAAASPASPTQERTTSPPASRRVAAAPKGAKHAKHAKPGKPTVAAPPKPTVADTAAVDTSGAPNTPADTPAAAAPPAKPVQNAEQGKFSVQVAAFYDRTQADALAAKLQTRGYTSARVEGTKAPYRVRLGHFKTHAEAARLLATLKAKKITGFVAEE